MACPRSRRIFLDGTTGAGRARGGSFARGSARPGESCVWRRRGPHDARDRRRRLEGVSRGAARARDFARSRRAARGRGREDVRRRPAGPRDFLSSSSTTRRAASVRGGGSPRHARGSGRPTGRRGAEVLRDTRKRISRTLFYRFGGGAVSRRIARAVWSEGERSPIRTDPRLAEAGFLGDPRRAWPRDIHTRPRGCSRRCGSNVNRSWLRSDVFTMIPRHLSPGGGWW